MILHGLKLKTFFLLLSILPAVSTFAADKVLSVVTTTGAYTLTVKEGSAFVLEVRVDDASAVAGAAFTVTYDGNHILVPTATSSFFGTFVSQNIPTPNNQGYVTVNSVDYYSPLVTHPESATGKTMLAGARKDNGSGANVALFTLHCESIGDPGTYTIAITKTTIENAQAGFAQPTEIDELVGLDNSSYVTHNVTERKDLTVTVILDADNDGISDTWEIDHVPQGTPAGTELTVFSASGDYDNDGYTDLQEFLNRNELDPQGAVYDPLAANAPYGTGYINSATFLPAVLQILLQ